jgi:hypothetical protein
MDLLLEMVIQSIGLPVRVRHAHGGFGAVFIACGWELAPSRRRPVRVDLGLWRQGQILEGTKGPEDFALDVACSARFKR